ncbi:class I SAM-dependent methyltransferase [Variovorax sp. dw_308]|uniref:class I SAM-dependent methyltransferase n=1 Tax=Variovorax sp. dw_308 TaxID=2721546 RepID=UPI001C43DBD0
MSGSETPANKPATASPSTLGVSSASDKVDFDDYSASYDDLLRESTKLYAEDSEYFARYKIDLIRDAIRDPVARVLEYGCGTGRNIGHLQKAFPDAEIVGSDLSAASLRIASENNPEVRFEVERTDLDLGRFDLIFVASVFHHIPPAERPSVMETLARRLSTGGSINIFEHNPFNPITRRIVNTCPFDADAILLKPSELRSLFRGAGLQTQRQTYCLFVPPRLSWFLPIERFLGWLPLGGQYWVGAGHYR